MSLLEEIIWWDDQAVSLCSTDWEGLGQAQGDLISSIPQTQ